MSLSGTSLGVYLVGAELGRGGMGTVYRAETLAPGPAGPAGAAVALKVFHPEHVEDERAFSRFRLEAEIGKEIHHPHLVRTYGIGSAEAKGRAHHFMVMELIEGRTLKSLLIELGTFPESLLLEVADQTLSALAAMHERGVVHRDIKPENIIITPDHRILLMDLGVARRVAHRERGAASQFVGSLMYAPPEQFAGSDVGPRADIYALGVSLYELATGENPYRGLDMAAVAAAKLGRELPSPRESVPDIAFFWDRLISTCVRLEPADRFASAAELRLVLSAGERGGWLRLHLEGGTAPSAGKALRRLRLERQTPMIGRATESGRLSDASTRALKEGGVLLLSGPAGSGKSRLVFEHVESAVGANGPLVAVGRSVGRGGRGFGPVAEILTDLLVDGYADPAEAESLVEDRLRDLIPESAGVLKSLAAFVVGKLQPGAESGLSKDGLFGAAADVLRALSAERPLLLVADDLHLADADTIELFSHVARCVLSQRILLVGVFDSDTLHDESPLQTLITLAEENVGIETLRLENLGSGAAEELIRAAVSREDTARALAPLLRRRCAGNPLMIIEFLAHLQATDVLVECDQGLRVVGHLDGISLPTTVSGLLSLRLATLDEGQREIIETAAALGTQFETSLLAAILEEEPIVLLQNLAVLEKKHRLLTGAGAGSYRFSSPSLHEATYEGIPPSLREEYHSLIADTMLEENAEVPMGTRAYEILRHLFLAARAIEATPFMESALAHMGANLSASEAAPFLEKLAVLCASAEPRVRLGIVMRLWAFHEMRASRSDEMRALEMARALAETLGEPGPRARVHALRAGSFWYAGDYDSAHAEALSGLEFAREAKSRKWEATCLHTLGVVAFRRGQVEPCVEKWRAALEIRREIDDRRGVASTLQALSLVMRAIGEEEHVLETMQEALAIWRAIGERRGEASMLMNIGNHFIDSARYEEGIAQLERALQMHRDSGALMNEAIVLTNLGHARNFLGRIDEARTLWERALRIFIDHANPNGELAVRTMLGGALAEYGEDGASCEHLEAAIAVAERTGNKAKLSLAHRALGQLLHDSGARAKGWAHLEAALTIDRELNDATGRALCLGLVGRAALSEGDHARAVDALSEALDDARGIEVLAPLVLSRLARAEYAAGDKEAAQAHAREGLTCLEAAESVSTRDGPEMFYSLYLVLSDVPLLMRARALLHERAAAVRNDTYREYLLTRAWPATEIQTEVDRLAADTASP